MAEATEKQQQPGGLEEFQREFVDVWRQVPDKGLFFGLLIAWLALFQFLGNSTLGYTDTPSLLGWLYNSYNAPNSEDGHGNLIPFVVLGLFWWKRSELLVIPPRLWSPGLALLGLGVSLHVAGFMAQQPRVSTVGFFVGIYGLIGLVWGWRWMRASFFPFFLFVFCIPIGSLNDSLTFPLRLLVTKISVGISHGFLGIDVVREGSLIFNSEKTFHYDVAPACSAIRSLISLFALTTIYGFITFKMMWKKVLMVVVAIPLAVLGNVVRITSVIIAAEAFGAEAGKKVHDGAGFIVFVVAIGAALTLGYFLGDRADVEPKKEAEAAS